MVKNKLTPKLFHPVQYAIYDNDTDVTINLRRQCVKTTAPTLLKALDADVNLIPQLQWY